jgi:hypothetical protein
MAPDDFAGYLSISTGIEQRPVSQLNRMAAARN